MDQKKVSSKQDYLKNQNNIFDNLKRIENIESNIDLLTYFDYCKFYGLLEPDKKEELINIQKQNNLAIKYILIGLFLSFFPLRILWKSRQNLKYYHALYLLPYFSLVYYMQIQHNEINFRLLKMKNDYFNKVNEFYKHNLNPLILNPYFLTEEIFDEDLRIYQEYLKISNTKL